MAATSSLRWFICKGRSGAGKEISICNPVLRTLWKGEEKAGPRFLSFTELIVVIYLRRPSFYLSEKIMANIISSPFRTAFTMFLLIGLYSCNTYNFSGPLPSDKKNIYEFPADWQGKWKYDADHNVIIYKNRIEIISKDYSDVVKGVWPKKNELGEFVYPGGGGYSGMYTANMDSLKQPKDTVPNFLLNGGHIYAITNEGKLEKGYHYTIDKDTFRVNKTDTVTFDLGRNMFLRKIDNNFYVLNILNQVVGMENLWWQVILIEKKGKDFIDTWECSFKLTKEPSMFYQKSSDYYFNSTWKAADIIKLIKQGAFEKCDPLKRLH